MRVPSNILSRNALYNMNSNLNKMVNYNEQMATGKRIFTPHQDPTDVVFSLKYRSRITENEQYVETSGNAANYFNMLDSSIDELQTIMSRTKSLAVKTGDGALSDANLTAMSKEIDQLLERVIQTGNTQYQDKFIFAGEKTETRPFEKFYQNDQVAVDFMGDSGEINKKITKFSTMKMNIPGNDLFFKKVSRDTQLSDLFSGKGIQIDSGFRGPVPGPAAPAQPAVTIIDKNNIPHDITYDTVNPQSPDYVETAGDLMDKFNAVLVPVGMKMDINSEGTNFEFKASDGDFRFKIMDNTTSGISGASSLRIKGDTDGAVIESEALYPDDSLFSILSDFSKALKDNEPQKVYDGLLGKIDGFIEKLANDRSIVGARANRVQSTLNYLSENEMNLKEMLSEKEDVDITETIVKLKEAENVYNLSLQVGAKLVQRTLMDYL